MELVVLISCVAAKLMASLVLLNNNKMIGMFNQHFNVCMAFDIF